ncbi:MAG: phosphoglucosamine mutase, partial [Alphaproteobacteria bacterium]|nr:phosphoglucosamine mutase [Alphaproteobacteria bacterium]
MMQKAVAAHKADIGLALDGDADRLILSDEKGEIGDGDQIMALIAESWRKSGQIAGGGVVATVMSNLGFERFLGGVGLDLKRTPVGDRHVVDHMRAGGYNIGGEQSGHVILGDYSTTGDGLIAALQVLAVVCQSGGKKVSEICRVFAPVPQLLVSVRTSAPLAPDHGPLQEAIRAAEKKIGAYGRILVRKSGTEPVIRIMAEGDDEKTVKEVVQTLREFVELQDRTMAQGQPRA